MKRLYVIIRAWPLPGAALVLASFAFTIFKFWEAWNDRKTSDWVDPLASILGGVGAFILAAILITRHVDSASSEAKAYGLARGLAAGYYFNFVRPLVLAIRDPKHSIHADIAKLGQFQIVGVLVGIPSSIAELNPEQHEAILRSLMNGQGARFELHELQVKIAGRPRPLFAKLILNKEGKCGAFVDIPTTLTVIADLADFFAKHGTDTVASDDEFISAARKEVVALAETTNFSTWLRRTLEEFQDVVSKVGSMEAPGTSVASIVHIVPLNRLKHRLNEIAGD